jgi:hypothetical protein
MAYAPSTRLPARRRWTVRGLVALATVFVVVGIFAVFANRQVLNADNWANTSSDLLANSAVRTAVTNTLVDNLYANVNVQAQVARALPPRLRGLSGPAANGLQSLAEQRINRFLERPAVQDVWKQANRLTAQQFINIAEGKSGAITSSGSAVVLDLRVMLINLARRLGLSGNLVSKIPPGAARIKILSANQVSTLQDGANVLRGLAIVLPALALLLYALAVYLARGRRRETLLVTGVCLVIAGALVLIGRNLIGSSVVDSLAKTEAVKPAANAAWSIGTAMLHDVAQATIVIGIPVIIAAWLAGPTGLATSARRHAAPWLRDRPGVTYSVVSALLLLVIAWAPIPATRKPIPVLILIGLVILGVEALRRQVTVEYPDRTADDVRAEMRATIAHARGRNGHARAADANGDHTRLDELERLSALHDAGALDDNEFAAEKAALQAGATTA